MSKRKNLLIATTALFFLAGCVNQQPEPYVYPDEQTVVSFDYSNNAQLKNAISQIHFLDNGDIDLSTLQTVLAALPLNDFYADHLVYQKSTTVAYLDTNGDHIDGDGIYSIIKTVDRNNERNSLSGTVNISDERWTKNETDPAVIDHTTVQTTGTYSLVPDVEKEIGDEIINCDNDDYDSKKVVGYSVSIWGNKMNLTQSADIAEKFNDVLRITNERNESVPDQYKFRTTLKSRKDTDSLTISLVSIANQPTSFENDHIFEEKYVVSVTILNGMISNTSYQYTQIEKSETADYMIKSELESRTLSHVSN